MEDEGSGRKFNKDLAELEHLQNLEVEADKALVSNDYSRAYRCLRSMVAAFFPLLTANEKVKVRRLLNGYTVSFNKQNKVLDLRFFVSEQLVSKKLHLNKQVDASVAADQ